MKKSLKGDAQSLRLRDGRPKNFQKDESGNLPIIFAFMIPIVIGLVGGAVDVGRFVSAKNQTMAALDSAVLAAGRAMQINGSTEADAVSAAETFYNNNRYTNFTTDQTVFSLEDAGSSIVANTTATVVTPFLSVMGLTELTINARSKALLQANGNAGTDLELSIMLDTTGSMGWNSSSGNTRMADLKSAAKDLIDIIVWDDQSQRTARIALAPFSEHVNVGPEYYQDFTKEAATSTDKRRTCVKERANTAHLYKGTWPNDNRKLLPYDRSWGTCKTGNVIVPLTNDKVKLKAAIDNLETTGGTAGHLGIAWAWYLLDNSWNRYWPTENDAKGYGQLTRTRTVTVGDASYEVPMLRKIAVLMTDGEFNVQHNGPGSGEQAAKLCTEMKAKGIELYAVAFEVGTSGNAYDIMSGCATSPDHFYNATDGDALRVAFRDIGLKVSTLRLAE